MLPPEHGNINGSTFGGPGLLIDGSKSTMGLMLLLHLLSCSGALEDLVWWNRLLVPGLVTAQSRLLTCGWPQGWEKAAQLIGHASHEQPQARTICGGPATSPAGGVAG